MDSKRVFLFGVMLAMALGVGGCQTALEDAFGESPDPGSYAKYKVAFGAPGSDKGGSGGSDNKD